MAKKETMVNKYAKKSMIIRFLRNFATANISLPKRCKRLQLCLLIKEKCRVAAMPLRKGC